VNTVRFLLMIGLWLLIVFGDRIDPAWAETVYVQARTAQLRSGKTSLDPVVETLRLGDALEVLRTDGKWLEVKTAAGTTGWIFSNKVSSTQPSGSDNRLALLGKSVRRGQASDVTASAGARGLDKASETYAQKAGITQQDHDAVDRMARIRLSDDDVQTFLKEGRLGEYAE
jgi:uncharacterized protein YgiM (DUF1202 family)